MRPPEFPRALRLETNPAIFPGLSAGIGTNINGPSLIEAPNWVATPLGKYYLYFAHHHGRYIRLAWANDIEGPWTIFEPGTLKLTDTSCFDHIASPDVHVCHEDQRIRMYFHGPVLGHGQQLSMLAVSRDGIRFQAQPQILGESYFRVFAWGSAWFAIARGGRLYRSPNGLADFATGPMLLPSDHHDRPIRHVAVKVWGTTLYVFYSRIGDCPECILVSCVDLTLDWQHWRASDPVTLLVPEMAWEGAEIVPVPSLAGAAGARVCELRDPAVFSQGNETFLLYSGAGESAIGLARLEFA